MILVSELKIDHGDSPLTWINSEMQSYFNNPEFSDIQLLLRDADGHEKTIHAHRLVLANKSDFFKTLFTTQFKEHNQATISVEVPTIEAAVNLIQWFYSNERFIPPELHDLADMWLVPMATPPVWPGISGEYRIARDFWSLTQRTITLDTSTDCALIRELTISCSQGSIEVIVNLIDVTGMSVYRRDAILDQKCHFYDYLEWHGISISTSEKLRNYFRLNQRHQAHQMIKLVLENNTVPMESTNILTRFLDDNDSAAGSIASPGSSQN
jgi:hypothetical protein